MSSQQSLFPDLAPTDNPADDVPLTADLRVLVRASDGRMCCYAWDGITRLAQLCDELDEARDVVVDVANFRPEETFPSSVRAVFADPATKAWAQSG